MKWNQLGGYIFLTDPDPLRQPRASRRQISKLVGVAFLIVIVQVVAFLLQGIATHRGWLPEVILGCGLDTVTWCVCALIAWLLHYASLRRSFHRMNRIVIASVLTVLGIVGSGMVIVAVYGE
jgi:threonine/homoserine/homoserine lactone efflux protein